MNLDEAIEKLNQLQETRDLVDAQIEETQAIVDALEAVEDEKALNAIGLSRHNWYTLKPEYDDWYKSYLKTDWMARSAREGHAMRVLSVQDNGLVRYSIPMGYISIQGVTPAELLIQADASTEGAE